MNFVYESEKLIALENNIELGFIWYQFKNSELTIIQTYVNENARGKGVAKLLNEELFKHFSTFGPITLHIFCSYTEGFYSKNKDKYPMFACK